MDIQIYVLEMRGERSGTFDVLPMENVASIGGDAYEKMWQRNLRRIQYALKKDREGDNPSIPIEGLNTN